MYSQSTDRPPAHASFIGLVITVRAMLSEVELRICTAYDVVAHGVGYINGADTKEQLALGKVKSF